METKLEVIVGSWMIEIFTISPSCDVVSRIVRLAEYAQRMFAITRRLSIKKCDWCILKRRSLGGGNSVVLVRKRTIPIERSPPVSEASANFSG
jgi:hypothetical protein